MNLEFVQRLQRDVSGLASRGCGDDWKHRCQAAEKDGDVFLDKVVR
jgi:hypothetical protein